MRRRVTVAAIVLLVAGNSRAEIRNVSTLEWLACTSDLILVGRVTTGERIPGEGRIVFDVGSVRVDEVLKGPVEGIAFRFAILRHSDGPLPAPVLQNLFEPVEIFFTSRGPRRSSSVHIARSRSSIARRFADARATG